MRFFTRNKLTIVLKGAFMKRIISVLLAVSMAFLLTCSALATTITDSNVNMSAQQDMINKVSEMLPLLCEVPADAECTLGSPLAAYRLEDGELTEIDYDVYPVSCNGNIVMLAQVPKIENGTDYINCVTAFAEGLDEFYKDNPSTSFALVYASDGVFALTPNGETTCIYSTFHEGLSEISDLSAFNVSFVNIQAAQASPLNSAIIAATNDSVMHTNSPMQTYSAQDSSVQYKILNLSIVANNVHDCDGDGQQDDGMCWAACIATIVNYHTGTNWSAMQIHNLYGCDEMYSSGERYAEIISNYGIDTYGPFPQLTYQHIVDMIDGDNPGFMRIEISNTTTGHAIVTYGYYYNPSTSSNQYFYYKDPNYTLSNGITAIPSNGIPIITINGTAWTYDYHIMTDY